jgi:preprotein translocase subunit SecE
VVVVTEEAKVWVYRTGVALVIVAFASLNRFQLYASAVYVVGLACLALSFDYTRPRERLFNLGAVALLGAALVIHLTRPEWEWWPLALWAAGLAGLVAGAWPEIQQHWTAARQFLAEVNQEMRRVTWPSGREVYATTIVVIFVSAFFGIYIWGLDYALREAVNGIFKLFGAV